MKSFIRKMKLNNKGNTLAIVLIGMLIVGVLGTVILNASRVNVDMKITNLKGKQNFYYVERAIDEIYIGIGNDVSNAMKKAYDDVIKDVIKKNPSGSYEISTTMNDDFRKKYSDEFISGTYADYYQIGTAVNRMRTFIENSDFASAQVKIDVEEYNGSGYPPSSVSINKKNGEIESIEIKNVVIKSTSLKGASKYESFVKTDFVIKVPEVDFSFDDSPSSEGLDEFFKYAIIANGEMSGKPNPDKDTDEGVLYVQSGKAIVNGNIYVGDYYGWAEKDGEIDRKKYFDKDGIYVGGNAGLVVNGANIISKGAVNLDTGAEVSFNGEDKIPAEDKRIDSNLPLRLWANDILLTGNGATANISGDCFIKDDLEVNGNQGTVDISGSYYGFGYKNISDTDMNEADSNEAEMLAGKEEPGRNDYYRPVSPEEPEHEKRSAVIVNGNGAKVRLASSGSKQLVLGGRAYIDLSGNLGQTKTADYMTGESISIKGNQKIYLLDNPSSFQAEEPSKVIPGNPASLSDLGLSGEYTLSNFFDNTANSLKLDRNQVIPKRVGDMVYFYHKEVNPDAQTQYVVDSVRNTTKEYWQNISDAVKNMDVREISIGPGTSSYTAGTAMQVDGTTHQLTTGMGGELAYGDKGIGEEKFIDIIKDVRNRYANIMYDLSDDRDEVKYPIGGASTDKSVIGKSPYDYYVRRDMLTSLPDGRHTKQIQPWGMTNNTSDKIDDYPIAGESVEPISAEELEKAKVDKKANLVIEIMDNKESGKLDIEGSSDKTYGVIVVTGDVDINRDFEGMIICGGDIKIQNGHTFTANPELMKLLCNKSTFLKNLIGGKMSTGIKPPNGDTSIFEGKDGLDFDSFVEIKNWRKNED